MMRGTWVAERCDDGARDRSIRTIQIGVSRQNSCDRKKTTKNYFIEVACDQKYKTGPQKNQEKGNKLR